MIETCLDFPNLFESIVSVFFCAIELKENKNKNNKYMFFIKLISLKEKAI